MRNFIQKEDFPYKTITGLVYDSGDYAMNLRKAVDLSNYYGWTKEKTMGEVRSGKEQHLLGVGISTYVEISSLGPEFPQSASLFVNPSGEITVTSGTSPHGQGHETPFAQIVADTLGVSVDEVTVTYGDTAQLPWGTFTAGSRSGALGGAAVLVSARKIRDKMAKISAQLLGVREDDLVFQNGQIFSRNEGQTDKKRLPFRKVASYAYAPPVLPSGLEPALYAYSVYVPSAYAFPFGTHVAVVDIEADTGLIKVLDYTAVDDVGNVINPLVVEGQVHGGVIQGLGQALLETVKYDEQGQLLTASFMDYQIPLSEDIPSRFNSFRTTTPTSANILGVKGVGEAGTTAATPAIMNAVADALSQIGIRVTEMPLTLDHVLGLIRNSQSNHM